METNFQLQLDILSISFVLLFCDTGETGEKKKKKEQFLQGYFSAQQGDLTSIALLPMGKKMIIQWVIQNI